MIEVNIGLLIPVVGIAMFAIVIGMIRLLTTVSNLFIDVGFNKDRSMYNSQEIYKMNAEKQRRKKWKK